ncbi:MAG TPA: hypothetical protein VGX78_01115, partial [Pirellulales bacterium]|nr:hypothetical protein [Pirellulales bacterium]
MAEPFARRWRRRNKPGSKNGSGNDGTTHDFMRRDATLDHSISRAMNKAFVKEPEDTGAAHCPRCGSLGIAVVGETLSAQLAPDDRRNLPDTAFFCPFARCDVVYFDQFERTVATGRLARPVFPKDPNAPICSCFDFTCDDIEADVLDGGV